jgi:hypothetical protein
MGALQQARNPKPSAASRMGHRGSVAVSSAMVTSFLATADEQQPRSGTIGISRQITQYPAGRLGAAPWTRHPRFESAISIEHLHPGASRSTACVNVLKISASEASVGHELKNLPFLGEHE